MEEAMSISELMDELLDSGPEPRQSQSGHSSYEHSMHPSYDIAEETLDFTNESAPISRAMPPSHYFMSDQMQCYAGLSDSDQRSACQSQSHGSSAPSMLPSVDMARLSQHHQWMPQLPCQIQMQPQQEQQHPQQQHPQQHPQPQHPQPLQQHPQQLQQQHPQQLQQQLQQNMQMQQMQQQFQQQLSAQYHQPSPHATWVCGVPGAYTCIPSSNGAFASSRTAAHQSCIIAMPQSAAVSVQSARQGRPHCTAEGAVANAAATAAAVQASYDSSSRVLPPGRCWGAQLKGDTHGCTPGFVAGRGHLKNKFCPRCSLGIDVPAYRVCAWTPELKLQLANDHREGFWSPAPAASGGGDFRVVNNTISCTGPELILYRVMPPDLPWAQLPEPWVQNGMVRLCLAKGTLVPAAELESSSRNSRKRPRRFFSRLSSTLGVVSNFGQSGSHGNAGSYALDNSDGLQRSLSEPQRPFTSKTDGWTNVTCPDVDAPDSGATGQPPCSLKFPPRAAHRGMRSSSAPAITGGSVVEMPDAEETSERDEDQTSKLSDEDRLGRTSPVDNARRVRCSPSRSQSSANDFAAADDFQDQLVAAYDQVKDVLQSALNAGSQLTPVQREVVEAHLKQSRWALVQARNFSHPDTLSRIMKKPDSETGGKRAVMFASASHMVGGSTSRLSSRMSSSSCSTSSDTESDTPGVLTTLSQSRLSVRRNSGLQRARSTPLPKLESSWPRLDSDGQLQNFRRTASNSSRSRSL
ncbi:hypothetical protein AB1Y20_015163 [Prymnesium parvum]|uniref:Uncharacterized protein n=1 Tax=Prymnesium parvum TaxID=97485 RepID=A0AB34JZS2_PRYPA